MYRARADRGSRVVMGAVARSVPPVIPGFVPSSLPVSLLGRLSGYASRTWLSKSDGSWDAGVLLLLRLCLRPPKAHADANAGFLGSSVISRNSSTASVSELFLSSSFLFQKQLGQSKMRRWKGWSSAPWLVRLIPGRASFAENRLRNTRQGQQ
ncbi:hypothetical protein VTK26DRAFT_397 [Humicola hyalothermophila]